VGLSVGASVGICVSSVALVGASIGEPVGLSVGISVGAGVSSVALVGASIGEALEIVSLHRRFRN